MTRIAALLLILAPLPATAELGERKPVLIESKRIWDASPHCAFTDLIRFRDAWFCCFREGIKHADDDGRIRVLKSADGVDWESAAAIAEDGVDLRDPKISITPKGRLMIIAGGSIWRKDSEKPFLEEKQTRVMFSDTGGTWTAPRRILEKGEWLWRVHWHEGIAYGVSYTYKRATHPDPAVAEAAETNGPVPPGPFDWKVRLMSSRDGVDWKLVSHLDVPGRPNEATVRIRANGEMVAMVRRGRGNEFGWIGASQPPYRDWRWHETEHRFGGPNFIVLPDDSLIAGGRQFQNPYSTVVAHLNPNRYEPALVLPSGGRDTGYPGMVWHEGELWVSYYSSHEDKARNPTPDRKAETDAAVYLARVRLDDTRLTHADVSYGPHERNMLDFWQAEREGPRPLIVFIHGGGWTQGAKSQAAHRYRPFLDKGISCAAINYRLTSDAPLPAPVHDAARAVQFLRFKAKEWNIDKERIALTGGSAGGCTSMWILLHDDLADPDSEDPVERESTRVLAAAVSNAQASLDPKAIQEWLGPNVLRHRMIWTSVGEPNMKAALANYEKNRSTYIEFSPYNHLTKDDPPLLMTFTEHHPMTLPSKDANHGIHHPVFGLKVKEKADRLGSEVHLNIPGDEEVSSEEYTDSTAFLVDKLLPGIH